MLAENNQVSENCPARVKKPKWSTGKYEDISFHKQRVNFFLSMTELLEYVLECDDVLYKCVEHIKMIDKLYKVIHR